MKNINELCHQSLLDTAEVLSNALGITEVRGNEDPMVALLQPHMEATPSQSVETMAVSENLSAGVDGHSLTVTSSSSIAEGEAVDTNNLDADLDELVSYLDQDSQHAEELSAPPKRLHHSDDVVQDDQWRQILLQHQLACTAQLLQMNILMHSITNECNKPLEKAKATDLNNVISKDKKEKPMRWSFHTYTYEASGTAVRTACQPRATDL